MTEIEWLGCTSPLLVLDQCGSAASARKLRLYACGWAARFWRLLGDDRSRDAILTAERFADGLATRSELIAAFNAAEGAFRELPTDFTGRHGKRLKSSKGTQMAKKAAAAARDAANPAWDLRAARRLAQREDVLGNARARIARCELLRDILGNPFHRVAVADGWLRWNDGCVVKLARAIYEEQTFADLPVLADALEEAGCADERVLGHCRGGSAHARGCWLLDRLLGKD
jgi:hypothetical protein